MIQYINPKNGNKLIEKNDSLIDEQTFQKVATKKDGIFRFINSDDDYADNFGLQWNYWKEILSDKMNNGQEKMDLILKRTNFNELEMDNKTILECGCGGGDDTEILLQLPFKTVYSFDLSNAVNRAHKSFSNNNKVNLFQASILDIPLPDESFDFVFCHRVLQHTPNPIESLRKIMKKVKPGGILFVHSYNKSKFNLNEYKYKYLPFTKRLPNKWILSYVNIFGYMFHYINRLLYKNHYTGEFARRFIPFYHVPASQFKHFSRKQYIELEKLITFDSLTPAYDIPSSWDELMNEIEEGGFKLLYGEPNPNRAIYFTAQKNN